MLDRRQRRGSAAHADQPERAPARNRRRADVVGLLFRALRRPVAAPRPIALELSELRDLTTASPAEARVLVVDSCRSGALTRVKGGHPVPNFDIAVEATPAARGLAILTSSAAGEDAQESDQLGASIFTHHLVSALLGAADRDRDGRVTVAEAFAYAADRTLAATVLTLPGPQHPTYRLEMAGRDDLPLTEPGLAREGRGALIFGDAGTFLVQNDAGDRAVVAEVSADRAGSRLTVEPGGYFVTERNREYLRQGTLQRRARRRHRRWCRPTCVAWTTRASCARARPSARAPGASSRSAACAAICVDQGAAFRGDLGLRIDLQPVSLELRAGSGASWHHNDRLGTVSQETALAAAALHMFDFDVWSAGFGLEAGAVWFRQHFDDGRTRDRNTLAATVAPLVEVEVPFGRAFYGRVDGAFPSYFLPATADSEVVGPRELSRQRRRRRLLLMRASAESRRSRSARACSSGAATRWPTATTSATRPSACTRSCRATCPTRSTPRSPCSGSATRRWRRRRWPASRARSCRSPASIFRRVSPAICCRRRPARARTWSPTARSSPRSCASGLLIVFDDVDQDGHVAVGACRAAGRTGPPAGAEHVARAALRRERAQRSAGAGCAGRDPQQLGDGVGALQPGRDRFVAAERPRRRRRQHGRVHVGGAEAVSL